jgi:CBS domain-containing protein
MRCDELMTAEVEVARAGETVRDAARKMRDLNIGFLPVIDAADLVQGVVTDRDITLRVVAEGLPGSTPVEEVMTEDVVSCHPHDDVRRAEQLMRVNQKARVLCIDDDGRVAGVISTADIAQYEDEGRTGNLIGDVTARETGGH